MISLLLELAYYSLLTLTLLALIGWSYLFYRRIDAERRKIKLASCEGTESSTVSVIIPARNEEARIARCLNSFLAQRMRPYELIVVDDYSSDSTPQIVIEEFLERGVTLVRPGLKPSYWQGKSWACWKGYKVSHGEWLLFIDSDTELLDDSLLGNALCYAERERVDALSLIPRLRADTFASKVMLPFLLNMMYVLTPPHRSNDPRDPLAFFFGAFILLKREVYEAVGGHEAVRTAILEDKALGENVKGRGYKTRLLGAENSLTAVFNESFRGYYNALLRLFTEYAMTSGSSRLWKYVIGALAAFVLPLLLLTLSSLSGLLYPTLLSIATLAVMASMQASELRRLKRPSIFAPLFFIPAIVVTLALLHVATRFKRGGVRIRWRGRECEVSERSLRFG